MRGRSFGHHMRSISRSMSSSRRISHHSRRNFGSSHHSSRNLRFNSTGYRPRGHRSHMFGGSRRYGSWGYGYGAYGYNNPIAMVFGIIFLIFIGFVIHPILGLGVIIFIIYYASKGDKRTSRKSPSNYQTPVGSSSSQRTSSPFTTTSSSLPKSKSGYKQRKTKSCGACGSGVLPDAVFCGECGTKV